MTIGFIGLGKMGLPMARNLLKAGFHVQVYNRSHKKSEDLANEGAKAVKSPREVLNGAEVVITMISNDKVLEDLVYGPHGLLEHMSPGTIHLSMSTVGPTTSRKLEKDHQAKGTHYLAATVSGRPEAAIAGKLWIFLAGEKKAKARVQPVLEKLGQKIFDIGDEAEKSNIYKLMNNFLIISAIQAIGEALTFAEKNGLSRKLMGEIIAESLFSCPIYRTYSPMIAEGRYEAGFALELGYKDICLLKDVAQDSGTPMHLGSLVHEQLLTCMARGLKDKDWAVIAQLCRENANIER